MRALIAIFDRFVTAAAWVAAAMTVLMMLHITADVTGRTLFGSPITGTIEIVSSYNMAALAFLPLALIARERGHIIVELFTGWMKFTWRSFTDAFAAVVTLIYTGVFTWKAIEIAIKKTEIREAKEAGIGFVEIWPGRWIVAVGFGLMVVAILIQVFVDFRRGMSGKIEETDTLTGTGDL